MATHFSQLFLLVVAALALASWGQEQIWAAYGRPDAAESRSTAAMLDIVEEQLRGVPATERTALVQRLSKRAGVDLELFEPGEISGGSTLAPLAVMKGSDGETWVLKRLEDDGRVLAFRSEVSQAARSPLEWAIAFAFYAVMALVIMIWLWPLTRDLRRLERATATFGDRNWRFDARVKPGSQVHPLAEAFRRMAARIESLIGSHKDMSHAIAHEIKTPLARMRFEIEMARAADGAEALARRLDNINRDIGELNTFVTAALDYAILERAEVALNVGEHDFTRIVPPLTEAVKRGAPGHIHIECDVASDATRVVCDAHLMETVVRNLLNNATRFARTKIRVAFDGRARGRYTLHVDDDGPGIPEADRERVFGSFVQLDAPAGAKTGYGLGLAIVKRIAEWHQGTVVVSTSPLGGARFTVEWPAGSEALG
jgi:two-component system, OmpR family, sensor kinase